MHLPPPGVSGRCPRCGRPLTADAIAGLCANCLGRRLLPGGPAATETEIALPPGFEFVEMLGQGGMGEVCLVFQTSLARYVALKRLSGGWQRNPRARERFLREAQTAGGLSHPGIVPILDTGVHRDRLWYTMEFVEGGDLAQLLAARGGRLPWREVVELVVKITEAIQHAHAAGVAHRDLKPSNILLDAGGAPKVADFGLAWLASHEGRELTVTGEVLGTPAYLPPEFLAPGERHLDPRGGDLYSLGALLYHLVAGQPPFPGAHPAEILAGIAHRPAPRLARMAAVAVPPALDELCARCLQKRPADRPASATVLLAELQACLADEAGRVWRRRRRVRRAWQISAIAAAATALAATGYYGQDWVREKFSTLRAPVASPLIAVMPLEAMTVDDTTAMLAAGLQDEIAATLVRISDVRVVTTRSMRALPPGGADYRTARESLGADAVLTGRIRRWEDRIWAAVQLIDARDGTLRWSRTYIRAETQALNLQTDVATEIALHLRQRLRPGRAEANRGTVAQNQAAQADYVRARALMTDASESVRNLEQAEAFLTEAVEIDPQFALAHAALSLVHTQMFHWGSDRSDRRLARGLEAAQTALQLNPNLPEAQVALGHYYFRGFRDYATAQLHLDRALALAPHRAETLEALAHVERRQGRFRDAGAHFETALRLDPLNAILAYNTADTFLRLREYEKASAILSRSLSLLPGHVALVKLRGDLYVAWKGDLGPMRDDTERRDRTLPTPDLYLMDRIDYLILAHRLEEACEILHASQLEVLEGQSIYLTREGYDALLLQLAGHAPAARESAARALPPLRAELARRPNDARVLLHTAQMQAILGDLPAARQLIERTLQPGDLARVDAFDRGFFLRAYAILLALAGEDTHAREILRTLLREPNQTSVHYLSLHPALSKYADEFL